MYDADHLPYIWRKCKKRSPTAYDLQHLLLPQEIEFHFGLKTVPSCDAQSKTYIAIDLQNVYAFHNMIINR